MAEPVLVLCAHGTDDPAGQAVTRQLAEQVRARGRRVVQTWVDVQHPQVAEVVAELVAAGEQVVVVPALLAHGYHTGVDIAEAVEAHPGRAVATPPLGPDPTLADLLHRRLQQVGLGQDDAVVLAAAGSSWPQSAEDVRRLAGWLGERLGRPVTVGFGAKAEPTVAEAVVSARQEGASRVVLASYLLAPGFFQRRVLAAGADAVTEPLGADPAMVEIVLQRCQDAVNS